MFKFIQHIPSFVDSRGIEPFSIEADTVEEMLENPFFDKFKSGDKFSHFAKVREHGYVTLMSVSDDGFKWWVVGYIYGKGVVNLPFWTGWKFKALLDGEKVIVGNGEDCIAGVVMSSGGNLTLTDGRVAVNCRW